MPAETHIVDRLPPGSDELTDDGSGRDTIAFNRPAPFFGVSLLRLDQALDDGTPTAAIGRWELADGTSRTVTVYGLIEDAGGSIGDDLIYGNALNNRLYGDAFSAGFGGQDVLFGKAGDDQLFGGGGADSLFGGKGDDSLTGGPGRDQLTGGRGADIFAMLDQTRSGLGPYGRDTITDFSSTQGDRVDFTDMDADINLEGDQDFTLITGDFSGDGAELRVRTLTDGVVIEGEINGDTRADLAVRVIGPGFAMANLDF